MAERKLPAWYYRVSRIVLLRDSESQDIWSESGPFPDDFDEDISEIASEDDSVCRCSSNESECNCDSDDADEPDLAEEDESYPEYKEIREERKKELVQHRKEHDLMVEYHETQEDEARKTFTEVLNTKTQDTEGQELDLRGVGFKLYSSEYIGSLPLAYEYRAIFVEFFVLDGEAEGVGHSKFTKRLDGQIHLNEDNPLHLETFSVPKQAGSAKLKIGICGHKETVTFKFMHPNFLQVVVPRHVALPKAPLVDGLDFLEFIGVRMDREKEMKRRREHRSTAGNEEPREKRREVSPRESWFELNHPDGWWAQSQY